ncbi:beta strand repeat-containing protein [Hymenobacter ruricola]|uniref:T9SS type A sorting domain-containing protein n=1 Tax=Hymenobacter ruricola TaxID=2791023 RepID=A0ABS0I4B2_9BACT|nr:hypothetical protein [Hymenobacter ruricola]MBF9221563.1 hypothetical protein [Hymenobacter ruricola]
MQHFLRSLSRVFGSRRAFRRPLLGLLLAALVLLPAARAWANTGVFEGYVVLHFGNPANQTYYRLNPQTVSPNIPFNGTNLGTLALATNGGVLNFSGGQLKTFKNSTCPGNGTNVTGSKINYVVYPTGARPATPSFAQVTLNYDGELNNPTNGDQQWTNQGNTANVLTGLAAGNYTLEVYAESYYDGCGSGTNFFSNNSFNYTATFSVSSLCGSVYTIDSTLPASATNFVSFSAAATALNNFGVTCATTFVVKDGTTYTEKMVLNAIAGASATNRVTFIRSNTGSTAPKIIAPAGPTSTTVDAIVALNGTDFVTFDGIDLNDPASNGTQALQMEMGYALFRTGAGATADGCQNNIIRNCNIVLQKPKAIANNTTGIYGANSTNASLTAVAATGATVAAQNSGNAFTNNTIENCNQGISLLGLVDAAPYANYDQDNNIGGSTAGTPGVGGTGSGNLLRNLNAFAGGQDVAGIRGSYQNNLTVKYNTVDNAAGGSPAIRLLRGISFDNGTAGIITASNNTLTLNNSGSNTEIRGIQASANGLTLTTSNNTFTIEATLSSSAPVQCFLIDGSLNTWTANANTWDNSNKTLATSGSAYFANVAASTPTATITFTNNTVTNVTKAAGATFYGYSNTGNAPATTPIVHTITGNTVSNITLTGATVFYGIRQVVGVLNGPQGIINGNTITNITGGTSSLFGINFNYGDTSGATANISTVNGNTIYGLTGTVASSTGTGIYGIFVGAALGASQNAKYVSINSNNIGTLASPLNNAGPSPVAGVALNASSSLEATVATNNILGLSSSSSGNTVVYGVLIQGGSAVTVDQNTITGLRGGSASTGQLFGIRFNSGTTLTASRNTIASLSHGNGTTGSVSGISVTDGTTVNVARNSVYDLSTSASGSTLSGISLSALSAAVFNVSNNRIADLRAPAATSSTGVTGLGLNATATYNIYYNSIRLTASSTAGAFGSTGIAYPASGLVDLRNNIVINKSVAGATGSTVALRRASGTAGTVPATTNLAGTTNNNIYFVSGTNAYVYGESAAATPTNAQATVGAYKTFIQAGGANTRESNSQAEDVEFVSTDGTSADFLRVKAVPASGLGTRVESGGVAIGGLTDDFETNNVRTGYPLAGQANGGGTGPDIGADEGDFAPPSFDVSLTALTAPLTTQTCFSATQTVTVTLKNEAATDIYFGANPVTLTGTVTGPNGTTTLAPVVVSTGTLAPNATRAVSFVTTADLTAPGTYTISLTAAATRDTNPANNTLAPVIITVSGTTTYTGAAPGDATNWFNAANWTNCVPTSLLDAVIPAGLGANYPSIAAGSARVRTLTLASGARLAQSGGTLSIYGDLVSSTPAANLSLTGGMVSFRGAAPSSTGVAAFYGLTVNLSSATATLTLANDLTVNNTLTMTQGVLSTGANTLTLPTTAALSPAETDLSYVLGRVAVPGRDLSTATAETFGNIGLTLTPDAASAAFPGLTTVVRTTGAVLTGVGASVSIKRNFDIQPTTNAGLSVAMDFAYLDHELNGIPAANLALFKSVSGPAGPWANQRPITAAGNVISKTGITDFSIWTLGNELAPLPVELTAFEATRQGDRAALTWTTATERHNRGFGVQVSTDGRTFRELAFVAGAGSSSTAHRYAYLDDEAGKAGRRYYRLRQQDQDGTTTYSAVRELEFAGAAAALSAAPVPFGAALTFTVRARTAQPATALTFTDATGRVVRALRLDVPAGTSQLPVTDLAALPAGLYLVQAVLDGQLVRIKVIKE